MCQNASQKLNALAQVSSVMNLAKVHVLMELRITSQCGYWHLFCIIYS